MVGPPPDACKRHLIALLSQSRTPDAASIAARLIDEFGSLAAVLAGSPRRQRKATGSVAAVNALQTIRAAMMHALRQDLTERPILSNWEALLDYLRADIAHRPIECVRVLHLNARNVLLCDELFCEGTIDQTHFYVREIMARAIEIGSAALIIAHNHPSGDARPSRSDIAATHALIKAGQVLGVTIHDHVVVSASAYTSMRARGLI